ncbi:uncharacterized protein LOC144872012 [Branchiostoma floridae x Branchiostoma japonicum]
MFAGIFSIFLERVNTLQATLICRELVYLKKKSAVKRLKSSLQFWSPLAELVQVDPRARADTSSCWENRAVVSNTTAYDGHQPLLYCCSRDMEIQCQQGHGRMHSLGEAILMLFHGPLCNDEKTYPNQRRRSDGPELHGMAQDGPQETLP